MKGISTKNPWAALIRNSFKPLESRTYHTKYRGEVLICSSAKPSKEYESICLEPDFYDALHHCGKHDVDGLKNGYALAVATLVNSRNMTFEDEKNALCSYPKGYYNGHVKVWELVNIRPIKPIPIKGKIFLFDIPEKIINQIEFV